MPKEGLLALHGPMTSITACKLFIIRSVYADTFIFVQEEMSFGRVAALLCIIASTLAVSASASRDLQQAS